MTNLNLESGPLESPAAPLQDVTHATDPNLAGAFEDAARLIFACDAIMEERARTHKLATAICTSSLIFVGLLIAFLSPRLSLQIPPYAAPLAFFAAIWSWVILDAILSKPSRKQVKVLKGLLDVSGLRAIELPGKTLSYTDPSLRHVVTSEVWQILPGVKSRSRDELFRGFRKQEPIRRAISEALARVLDQVKPEDARLFTDFEATGFAVSVSTVMSSTLEKDYDEPLLMACINVAADIGGERTYFYFKEIMDMEATSERQLRIKNAVANHLPALKARWLKKSQADKLLRPATAESKSILLKPVGSGITPPKETLVRPTEQNQ